MIYSLLYGISFSGFGFADLGPGSPHKKLEIYVEIM